MLLCLLINIFLRTFLEMLQYRKVYQNGENVMVTFYLYME